MKVTAEIKEQLQSYGSVEERFDYLKDLFKGETAYLVSCGPSLTTHDREVLKEKLSDKLVLCAKQAQAYLGEVCDFHLVSTYNYQPYEYPNPNTIKSFQLTACNMENELRRILHEFKSEIDLYFPVISGPWITLEGTTAYTRNFDNWKQLGQETRVMWGPGILYESGFPLCYHLGVKKIVTIGWDIGDLSRYQGQERDPDWFEQHAKDIYVQKTTTSPTYNELKNTIECTKEMYDWFVKEGIEVNILSDRSPADERFKRITIEEL